MGKVEKKLSINYIEYLSLEDLPSDWYQLSLQTIINAKHAYAPYSNFLVSAALRLRNGHHLYGTNIENASFPVGTCAERNVLSYAISNFSEEEIALIVVYGRFKSAESNSFISPCGMCRQAILEAEKRQNSNITILLLVENGRAIAFDSAQDLLPMSFDQLKY